MKTSDSLQKVAYTPVVGQVTTVRSSVKNILLGEKKYKSELMARADGNPELQALLAKQTDLHSFFLKNIAHYQGK